MKFNACPSERKKKNHLNQNGEVHGQLLVHFKSSHKDKYTIIRIIKEGPLDICVGFITADQVINDHDPPGNM